MKPLTPLWNRETTSYPKYRIEMNKVCILCSVDYSCRWINNQCNACYLKEKRRSKGIPARNRNFNKKEYKKQWYLDNRILKPKIKKELKPTYHKTEKGKNKQKDWIDNNKRKVLGYKKKYRDNNKDTLNKKRSEWKKENKGKVNHYTNLRRTRLEQRTPNWIDLTEIKNIYINCPQGYDVDHIIPLNGKNISGLHVPWNLQYLPKKENQQKSNKLILSYLNNEMDNYKNLLSKDGEKE